MVNSALNCSNTRDARGDEGALCLKAGQPGTLGILPPRRNRYIPAAHGSLPEYCLFVYNELLCHSAEAR